MGGIRLYLNLTKITFSKFCQQIFLLAGLAVAWVVLPVLVGLGAEQALSDGVSFSGITLAVTAPDGDAVPELLEKYLVKMADIRQYCRVEAMEYGEAVAALSEGDVTAIVVLPEEFVQSVQWGENPDVRIVVDGGRPVESLLTLWVGESASDLLAAVQAGIYAVSELYDSAPPQDLSRGEMLADINLRYIQWTLDRGEIFEEEEIFPTESLPVAPHYTLCILAFLALAMAPLFSWNFQGRWLSLQRRLGYAKRSALYGFFASVTCCVLVLLPILWAGLVLAAKLPAVDGLGVALLWAALTAVFAAFCALLTDSASLCGGVSFAAAFAALFTAGGVIPPVLLPDAVRHLERLSPVAWMRDTAALALEYSPHKNAPVFLAGAAVLLCAASALLYVRRIERRERNG